MVSGCVGPWLCLPSPSPCFHPIFFSIFSPKADCTGAPVLLLAESICQYLLDILLPLNMSAEYVGQPDMAGVSIT